MGPSARPKSSLSTVPNDGSRAAVQRGKVTDEGAKFVWAELWHGIRDKRPPLCLMNSQRVDSLREGTRASQAQTRTLECHMVVIKHCGRVHRQIASQSQ